MYCASSAKAVERNQSQSNLVTILQANNDRVKEAQAIRFVLADDKDAFMTAKTLSVKDGIVLLETCLNHIVEACESHGIFSQAFTKGDTSTRLQYGIHDTSATLNIIATKSATAVACRPYGAESLPMPESLENAVYMPRTKRWTIQFREHILMLFHKFTALNGVHVHTQHHASAEHGPVTTDNASDKVVGQEERSVSTSKHLLDPLSTPTTEGGKGGSGGRWALIKKSVEKTDTAHKAVNKISQSRMSLAKLQEVVQVIADSRLETMDAAEYVAVLNAVGLLPSVTGKLGSVSDILRLTVIRFEKKLGTLTKNEVCIYVFHMYVFSVYYYYKSEMVYNL